MLTQVTIMVQKVDLSAFSRDNFLILLANVRVKFVVVFCQCVLWFSMKTTGKSTKHHYPGKLTVPYGQITIFNR